VKAKEEYFNKKFNVFDGTYHNEDGSRTFSPEGQVVDGVNNYHQDTKTSKFEKDAQAELKAKAAELKLDSDLK
jgi:hypothetical protein